MKAAVVVKVSLYKTMRLPPKVQACPRQNGQYGRLPGGPRWKRPVRARSTTGPKTTADTFTIFSGSKKSGRYVYGFQRAPKKRPIRLRFSARLKKAANTFTVFGGAKKNGRHVYGFWHKSHPYRGPCPYRPFLTVGRREVARTGSFVGGTPVL